MSPKTMTKKPIKRSSATGKKSTGFTAEERAAMKDRVREMKSEAKGDTAAMEKEVLDKIAGMKEPDRSLAKRIHAIVKAAAPDLSPKLWYGMPAYAREGKIVCYFQDAAKFKARYATLGFSDKANLDEGEMWPVVYALKKLSANEEAMIIALLKKALG